MVCINNNPDKDLQSQLHSRLSFNKWNYDIREVTVTDNFEIAEIGKIKNIQAILLQNMYERGGSSSPLSLR